MGLGDIFDSFFNSTFKDDASHRSRDQEQWFNHQWNDHDPDMNDDERDGFNFTVRMDPFLGGDLIAMMDRFMRGFQESSNMTPFHEDVSAYENEYERESPRSHVSLRDQVLKPSQDNFNDSGHSSKKEENTFLQPQNRGNMDRMIEEFFNRSFYAPFLEKSLPKEDTDLDSDIQKQGLDAILKKDQSSADSGGKLTPFRHLFSNTRSMQQSHSVIRRSDGSREERITKRDSDGNEETTIITETPSGEIKTEIIRSDGTHDVIDEDSCSMVDDLSKDRKERYNNLQPRIFSSVNSILKELFS